MKKYGWLPDRPDYRDLPYMTLRPLTLAPLVFPEIVDLRKNCPPIYDQGALGSCTAQAIVAAYEMELIKHVALPDVFLSSLFLYYNERLGSGTVHFDSGAYIRDGIKTIVKDGICLEALWPYIISDFTKKPSLKAYKEAKNHQAIIYAYLEPRVMDVCLALSDGYPVIFGFTVYESFESEEVRRTGIVSFPKSNEHSVGGHAVLAVGYNLEKQHLIVRNSWGTDWGQDGYFWMPFSYMESLARDFWVLKEVE